MSGNFCDSHTADVYQHIQVFIPQPRLPTCDPEPFLGRHEFLHLGDLLRAMSQGHMLRRQWGEDAHPQVYEQEREGGDAKR